VPHPFAFAVSCAYRYITRYIISRTLSHGSSPGTPPTIALYTVYNGNRHPRPTAIYVHIVTILIATYLVYTGWFLFSRSTRYISAISLTHLPTLIPKNTVLVGCRLFGAFFELLNNKKCRQFALNISKCSTFSHR